MDDKNNNQIENLKDNEKKDNGISYIALGVALGVSFGVAFKNVGIGIALGVVGGTVMEAMKSKKN